VLRARRRNVIIEGSDLYGDSVNLAARLASLLPTLVNEPPVGINWCEFPHSGGHSSRIPSLPRTWMHC
jgi:hypothetical protein